MRRIAVVTGSRADFTVYTPLLRALHSTPEVDLRLIVTGMHLSPEFGYTIKDIAAAGFDVAERVEMLMASDRPGGMARSMGIATLGFADVYERVAPDILVLLGDRFEMHAAAVAALPFGIPIAHIAGGLVTEGAIDDIFRHSISKMAHLHFVETKVYGERLARMGEEAWRISVTGALALDNLRGMQFLDLAAINQSFGLNISSAPVVVTFHPVTREPENLETHADALLSALAEVKYPLVLTYPNADFGGRRLIERYREFAASRADVSLTPNLGTKGYFSLLKLARAMVGNSSSGIVESASFHLPVLNIGNRQSGRVIPDNVINADPTLDDIRAGLKRVLSEEWRQKCLTVSSPYGDGRAAGRMLDVLTHATLGSGLMTKKFSHG